MQKNVVLDEVEVIEEKKPKKATKKVQEKELEPLFGEFYEKIRRANAEVETMDIKGKAYAQVHDRVTAFRKVYPTGFINTKIISLKDGVCIFGAEAGYWTEDGEMRILGNGTAYEWRDDRGSFVNKTSYIENAETSAVGRALGFVGFGSASAISSYDEVNNAIEAQKAGQEAPPVVLDGKVENGTVKVAEKATEPVAEAKPMTMAEAMVHKFENGGSALKGSLVLELVTGSDEKPVKSPEKSKNLLKTFSEKGVGKDKEACTLILQALENGTIHFPEVPTPEPNQD